MPEARVIVKPNVPAARLFSSHTGLVDHFVTDDVDILGFWSYELLQEWTNDDGHSGRQNNNGDPISSGPFVEVIEVWVKLDIL